MTYGVDSAHEGDLSGPFALNDPPHVGESGATLSDFEPNDDGRYEGGSLEVVLGAGSPYEVMDHWDEVLPGRVHRVQYEEMVADTEAQIRALLDYCGLDFEEQCLRFYETDRAIRTPSAEQVRKPIYKEGLEQWRNFEAHLDPLKEALGPDVRQRYSIDL